MTFRTETVLITALGIALIGSTTVRADEKAVPASEGAPGHVMVSPGDLTWAPGPLPGTQAAVLEGDPRHAGPFTMRLQVPAEGKIPPHWHPADEHVTVISGRFNIGTGDAFDPAKGTALPVGSFAMLPANAHHFAWAKEDTVIQLHGTGPWQITFVNPADDPRKK